MFFGLDISDQSLRLIQLKKKGKKIFIDSYNDLEIKPGIISNGEIKEENELSNLFRKLIKSSNGSKVSTKNIITVLPESKTFIKVIEIENANNKKDNLPELINEEIKKHIPLSSDEIYIDWQIIKKISNNNFRVLVGVVSKITADSYLKILEASGLNPYIFEIEAAAITRALLNDNEPDGKIIIDFGAARTGLIVYDNNTIQFTVSLPISGNNITETIAKTLNLDRQKAEEAKIICGLDQNKCDGALLKILMEPVESLAKEIKKAINFYQINSKKESKISEIILCGGGANFLNIEKIISEKTGIPARIGNPLIHIAKNKRLSIPQDKVLSYTTAIGLGLRALEKNNV